MPIYEYNCDKCGTFEVMQRITESPLKKCPKCKSKVERILSRSSFILKGSGWYATDYANKGSSTASSASSETNGSSQSKSSESSSTSSSSSSSSSSSTSSTKASDKPAGKSAD